VRITVGRPRIRINFRRVKKKTRRNAGKAIAEAAQLLEGIAKSTHAAGGAGGPPAEPGRPARVQTGNLLSNIIARKFHTLLWKVGYGRAAWYGAIHERGGRYHPKRPILRPAFIRARPRFRAIFRKYGLRLR
jgi:HK97 gp10 family phage protein